MSEGDETGIWSGPGPNLGISFAVMLAEKGM
jgi:hypothetical protein